jgi:hypothetical protein
LGAKAARKKGNINYLLRKMDIGCRYLGILGMQSQYLQDGGNKFPEALPTCGTFERSFERSFKQVRGGKVAKKASVVKYVWIVESDVSWLREAFQRT